MAARQGADATARGSFTGKIPVDRAGPAARLRVDFNALRRALIDAQAVFERPAGGDGSTGRRRCPGAIKFECFADTPGAWRHGTDRGHLGEAARRRKAK
jgi:hypothetical protein